MKPNEICLDCVGYNEQTKKYAPYCKRCAWYKAKIKSTNNPAVKAIQINTGIENETE